MNAISFEAIFTAISGLLTTAMFAWVKSISQRIDKGNDERKELAQAINDVRRDYQTREDARILACDTRELLHDIKTDIKDLREELKEAIDRKADK